MKKRAASEFSRRCGSFAAGMFAVFVLANCGGPGIAPDQIVVTVQTQPQGAMLYSNGAALGMAPQTWVYTADAQAQSAGWMRTANVTAIWPSGAKAETSVTLLTHQGPQDVMILRPAEAPGLDVDEAHALRLQKTKTPPDRADAQARHDAAQNPSTQQGTTAHTECEVAGNTIHCRPH